MELRITLVLVCVIVTVTNAHKFNTNALMKISADVEMINETNYDINNMMNALETSIIEKLSNLPDASSDVDIKIAPVVTKTTSSGVKEEWLERLKVIEQNINSINNYLQGERTVDNYLNRLSGDLMEGLKDQVKQTEDIVQKMKAEVQNDLSIVNDTLNEVDQSAKSRNVVVSGVLYYGGIGSTCSPGSDGCLLPETECRDGICMCSAGLSYDGLNQVCVTDCEYYGFTYQMVSNRIIRGFNNDTLEETTLAECKEQCQENTDFTCRSFDFFPRWRTCYLSEMVKTGVPDASWEYNSAGYHFQRDCFVE